MYTMYECLFAYTCILYTCMCVYVFMHVCLCIVYVCKYACIYVGPMYVCKCVCTFVSMFVGMQAFILRNRNFITLSKTLLNFLCRFFLTAQRTKYNYLQRSDFPPHLHRGINCQVPDLYADYFRMAAARSNLLYLMSHSFIIGSLHGMPKRN